MFSHFKSLICLLIMKIDFELAFLLLFSASILRHVYLRNGLGVGHLTRVYGGIDNELELFSVFWLHVRSCSLNHSKVVTSVNYYYFRRISYLGPCEKESITRSLKFN